jgi:hypothetical protein
VIDVSDAAGLIGAMEGLRDFPHGKPEAIAEIAIALQCADSIADARHVIDEFVHWGNGYCPAPSAIRKALFAMKPPAPETFKVLGDEVGRNSPKAVQAKNGYSCGFVCEGWGTVGERPNVTWCTCEHARWLQREIPNWLEIANSMPQGGMNPAVLPRSFTGQFRDTMASGTRAGARRSRSTVREPGDESEYE